MFIYSFRANTLKFCGVVGVALVALVTLVAFIPSYEPVSTAADPRESVILSEEISYDKIKTNDDRIAFLKQFGWEVDPDALEETEVVIPEEFDKIFTGYNELQMKQGFDLSKYKRKKLMRYTYKITNYTGYDGVVFANILIKGKKVVGGDVCSEATDGFIHGFSKDTSF